MVNARDGLYFLSPRRRLLAAIVLSLAVGILVLAADLVAHRQFDETVAQMTALDEADDRMAQGLLAISAALTPGHPDPAAQVAHGRERLASALAAYRQVALSSRQDDLERAAMQAQLQSLVALLAREGDLSDSTLRQTLLDSARELMDRVDRLDGEVRADRLEHRDAFEHQTRSLLLQIGRAHV